MMTEELEVKNKWEHDDNRARKEVVLIKEKKNSLCNSCHLPVDSLCSLRIGQQLFIHHLCYILVKAS